MYFYCLKCRKWATVRLEVQTLLWVAFHPQLKDSEMLLVNLYQTSDSSLVFFSPYPDTYEGDSYFTDLPVDETDLDFAGNIKMKSKKGKKGGEDDSDSDLDDVSLGSLDEEDFGDELGEEGGAFMDSIGEDDEEVPELDDDNADSDEMEVPHIRPGSKMRKASEDLDFSGSLGSKPGKKRKGGHSHVCIC
ncbi:CCAAT/enhancer-binding protein zeta-like isoform X1 [Salvelinus fontinalis]|uniref:CCAAT/enhancer-binding protein zeta-like isoform X1 n=1 Tax=Salvelinus fontinalis TaxID=8038 RepID=UPI0024864A2F|nr:CCAAT/enhancer-binding protein zeta-like isoform X1 [Salvelinus fontinalis]